MLGRLFGKPVQQDVPPEPASRRDRLAWNKAPTFSRQWLAIGQELARKVDPPRNFQAPPLSRQAFNLLLPQRSGEMSISEPTKGLPVMKAKLSLALIAALAMTASASHAGCLVPDAESALQAEVLASLNAERAARNLPKLKLHPALEKAAEKHACDNASRHSISHVSSDGSKLQHRLLRVGYKYSKAAENTGRGFSSGKNAVNWWMNSPPHKANILMKGIKDVGIGIVLSSAPDSRLHWIVVVGAAK
jgi:uncharacterized protein YkwD